MRALLDLRLTMESGQPPEFFWNKTGGKYWRDFSHGRCYLWQSGDELFFSGCDERQVREFLRLEDSLEEIYEVLSGDAVLAEAVQRFRGLRITKNDPWETLVAFICSINNNIPRIRRNVQCLLRNGQMPRPEELAGAKLAHAKLGFRERYLRETASRVSSMDFGRIGRMGYDEAKQELMKLPGVGEKVADCVLLFGFGYLEAFPLDVWIHRAMRAYYGISGVRKIRQFAREQWHPYEGYAQQYLYVLVREHRPQV
ncbi:DNA-3-methyladenine glycosylase family protein [Candidatus Pyrohabitans sp.]